MQYASILVFFFISGLTGLVYEILWSRLITKVIGSAPFAVSIVLTVFMGGLGLGSYIASRYIDRIKNPRNLVKLYGILEIVIGIYGLVLPLLLIGFKPLHSIIYNHLFTHFFTYNIFTFLGCFVLLILPVTCMGATLPVLSRFYVTSMSHMGTHIGRLYGLNTIGAAAGSFLCGFFMIKLLGIWGTMILAVSLNVLIGLSCLGIGFLSKIKATVSIKAKTHSSNILRSTVTGYDSFFRSGSLIIFSVSGFCAMAYEVIWTKLLGLIVGPTTYSFTIVLVTFITGLALGSMFFGWLGDKTNKPLPLLLYTQIAAGITALWISHIMGNSQIFFAKLIYNYSDNFARLIFFKSSVLFAFMFLPTFLLGATFPLVGKIYTRSLKNVGKSIGFAYAVNAIGAVLGSFCAGFILIPLLGKELSLSLIIAFQILVSFGFAAIYYWKTGKIIREWIPLVLLVIYGLVMTFPYPHWNRTLLSVGKYHRYDEPELLNMGWLVALFYGTDIYEDYHSGKLVYFGDGIGGFTTVKEDIDIAGNVSYSLFNSGKSDASTDGGDMCTQILLAHFPMLFHNDPENVMVLGLASGITAGEVLHYPVEHLDVIDINKQVVQASAFFTPWNNDVLSNPKTGLIIQDGRAHIELTNRRYDVIISEPSNPWMAGLATLFTYEFFSRLKNRLEEDGIFCQWVHAYQMDWRNFSLIGRTFGEVFPNSLLVVNDPTGKGTDYLLVGFKGEKRLDIDTAARNLPYAQQSKNFTMLNHKLFYNLIVSEDIPKLFGSGPINSDNRPELEFAAPKLMNFYDPAISENILAKKWLSRETKDISQEVLTSIDGQIDFVAYALSFDKLFIELVDLSNAVPAQKERFSELIVSYCSDKLIVDFSFINDSELKKKCISAQIDYISEKTDITPDKASLLCHLGNLSDKNGMEDEAVSYYQKTLKIDPEYDSAHYNLARILASQGNIEQAISHYTDAIRANPYLIMAYNNLGNILVNREKPEEAITLFRAALSINPDFAIAHKNLGHVLKKLGKTEEGETHIQEALRLEGK